MNATALCESVSAATHGMALIAAIPGTLWLRKRCESGLRRPVLVYGLSLIACFGASTICHAFAAMGIESRIMIVLDHMAIYALIAGTYTPIAAGLLPVRNRLSTLRVVWVAAAAGMLLNAWRGPLPSWLETSFYLAMGWGGLWCYFGMCPNLSHKQLALVPVGGLIYSIGAIFHVTRQPALWPGIFEAHELFHVFVVAGAATHYVFLTVRLSDVVPIANVPSRPRLWAYPRRVPPLNSRS